MISVSILFFHPLNVLSLCSLSAVSNSFYRMLLFSFFLTFCLGLFHAIPHRTFGLPSLLFPPPSGHLLSLSVFHLLFFPYDRPMSTYSSPISSLNFPSLQPPLSVHPFLLSGLFTRSPSPVVSMLVASSRAHAG